MDWPPDEELLAAWRELATDHTTAGAFCNLVLQPLIDALRARNPAADPAHADTAAGDALLSLIKNPAAYDPDKLPVRAYLLMVAHRDLLNLLAKDTRRRGREKSLEAVELDPPARNEEQDDDSPFDLNRFQAILADLSETDRRAVELMKAGERSTDVFAEVFGLTHLSVAEQRRAVKQHKDRLMARLKRAVRDDHA